ncbi:Aste57867_17584 [Aphanomyces stellatus]|uniref:RING-type E3 ubiquitin transferase n=1 Tax=Aphanomyces stellatus TaxID=120398 RepID=A0A485L8B2_9STRA|nr:hypothetical protein As57867_017524 [Aphanomyces stellatus]VFT94335.1 Aste57867_17584 [Aphanomyces stellatus]
MVANTEVASDVMESDIVAATAARQESSTHTPSYWCHLCTRNVETRLNSESDEVECQSCGGSFVEEVEEDTPGQDRAEDFVPPEGTSTTAPLADSGRDGYRSRRRVEVPNTMDEIFQMSRGLASDASATGNDTQAPRARRLSLDELGEGPARVLRNRIFTRNGRPVEVFITGTGGADAGSGLLGALGNIFQTMQPGQTTGVASNIGDYAFGNISNIINHLMQNDPNQHGAPPAAKTVMENLPKVHISQEEVDCKHDCAVCKDMFELKEEALRLPCTHDFHSDCILPWLKQHNSCPVCRFELPTDDHDYERMRSATATTTASTSAGSSRSETAEGLS